MLTYHTAGDSHGEALLGILENYPAQVPLPAGKINQMLVRRQGGYGRSERQQIERDEVRIIAGVWRGKSTGAPIGLMIKNRADTSQETVPPRVVPRPGHADLAGAWKHGWEQDINPVIERASARETAMRTAIGAICALLLHELEIDVLGHVRRIGTIAVPSSELSLTELRARVTRSPFFCGDPQAEPALQELVDTTRQAGDSLGGEVEIIAENVPPGLGSLGQPESRLDAQLALALMGIPSVKAVEIGAGIQASYQSGSAVHDEISIAGSQITHKTNHAGGVEGGMSNGERLIVHIFLKPIPTLIQPLASVNLQKGSVTKSPYIRSDVVVVPAASVVAEAMVAFVLARAILEKFGHDHLNDIQQALRDYQQRLRFFAKPI